MLSLLFSSLLFSSLLSLSLSLSGGPLRACGSAACSWRTAGRASSLENPGWCGRRAVCTALGARGSRTPPGVEARQKTTPLWVASPPLSPWKINALIFPVMVRARRKGKWTVFPTATVVLFFVVCFLYCLFFPNVCRATYTYLLLAVASLPACLPWPIQSLSPVTFACLPNFAFLATCRDSHICVLARLNPLAHFWPAPWRAGACGLGVVT